jgi:hypothetical protein
MKKLLTAIGITSILLVACVAPTEETESKGKDIWEVIGQQEINTNTYTELRHKETGCHYTLVEYGSKLTYVPMFITNTIDAQIPYCTEK